MCPFVPLPPVPSLCFAATASSTSTTTDQLSNATVFAKLTDNGRPTRVFALSLCSDPETHFLALKLYEIPFAVFEFVRICAPDVSLCLDFVAFHVALSGFVADLSQCSRFDYAASIFRSFEDIQPPDVGIGKTSDVYTTNCRTLVRKDGRVVCCFDAMSAVVVENRWILTELMVLEDWVVRV